MGIIQRQSFKSSIISYIGVGIGILSTLCIYPDAVEIIGLFRALFDTSVLIGIVVMMGSSVSAIRFFPKYKDDATGHNGLLSWMLMVSGVCFLAFLLVFPLLSRWLGEFIFHEKNKMYADLVIYIVPLTLLLALINLLSRYISNFRLITIPAIFDQLTIKITLPIIVVFYLQGWLSVKGVVIAIVASFAFSALGLIYYLMHLGEWRLTRPAILKDKSGLKEYSRYSWYGLLAGVGSQVAFRIDSLMISAFLQFQATGVYSISLALSEVISKPMRSLTAISGPLLATHIENNNLTEIRNIYKKSSLNMTIIGTGLFLVIWSVLPYIFRMMSNPDVMEKGTYVVFFLGLAQVFDMMTGVNNEIISYSKYYRFTLYLTLLLAVINILANLLFIPMYGLPGAALATCLSMFLFNIVKLVFIKSKFGFYPFSPQILMTIGFGMVAWMVSYFLPESSSNWVNLMYKGAVFVALFGGAVWRFNISPDINHWIQLGWTKGLALISGPK